MSIGDKTIEVFLDGESRYVPSWVADESTFRIALRAPRGLSIVYADRPNEPIDFYGGHIFVEGDKYVTTKDPPTAEDDEQLEPWQTDPDAWKK